MLYPEEDSPLLKAWIIKRLENTSDADADVLADYVIALLHHDGDVATIRKLCEAEIPDFLQGDSSVFVNDVFQAIAYRTYRPGASSMPKPAKAPLDVGPAHPTAASMPDGPVPVSMRPGSVTSTSRKRSYHDRGDVDGPNGRDHASSIPIAPVPKQPRRGGARGGGRPGDSGVTRWHGSSALQPQPQKHGQQQQLPMPDHALPAFDPMDPLATFLQFQALGMPILPMPDFSLPLPNDPGQGVSPYSLPQPANQQVRPRPRCWHFDTKGYCERGNACNFDHGIDAMFLPPLLPLPTLPIQGDEYDPFNAMMNLTKPPNQPSPPPDPGSNEGNGNARPTFRPTGSGSKKRPRAPFSAEGPVHDRSKTTVVVENVPEENFTEEHVRTFFQQFGSVSSIIMRPYKRLAVIKFSKWEEANAAYRSPKVVFDNRFVKVFWYKEEGAESSLNGSRPKEQQDLHSPPSPTTHIDMDDFLRKQTEAQKTYEERIQKKVELDKQRLDLEKRRRELLAKQSEEKQKLEAKLLAAGEDTTTSSTLPRPFAAASSPAAAGRGSTDALRAQLARLEAEALTLGIDPNMVDDHPSRGGYRGRGTGLRARGFASRGGGGRGRGAASVHAAYSVYSIDNRPKVVAVSGTDFSDPRKDEALRQYLLGIGEFRDVRPTSDATYITFGDRKTAEKFFKACSGTEIPGIDVPLEVAWVTTSSASPNLMAGGGAVPTPSPLATGFVRRSPMLDTAGGAGQQRQQQQQQEMDYDVAEDDWEPA